MGERKSGGLGDFRLRFALIGNLRRRSLGRSRHVPHGGEGRHSGHGIIVRAENMLFDRGARAGPNDSRPVITWIRTGEIGEKRRAAREPLTGFAFALNPRISEARFQRAPGPGALCQKNEDGRGKMNMSQKQTSPGEFSDGIAGRDKTRQWLLPAG